MAFRSLLPVWNALPGSSTPASTPSWATSVGPNAHIQRPGSAPDDSTTSRANKTKASAILFIVLNILRVLTVVGMVLMFSSQVLGMCTDIKAYKVHVTSSSSSSGSTSTSTDLVTGTTTSYDDECDYVEYSSVPDQPGGIVWAELNRVFILIFIIILLPTELSLPKRISTVYTTYLPTFSPSSSLAPLGVALIWLSVVILSKYCGETLELVGGWWGVVIGVANLVLGVCLGVSARRRRLIFSWENAAQMTPKTQMAYRAYETYNEKLRPFISSANNPSVRQNLSHTNTFKSARSSSGSSVASSQATMVGADDRTPSKVHHSAGSMENLLPTPTLPSSDTRNYGLEYDHAASRYAEPDLRAAFSSSPAENAAPSSPIKPGRSFGGFGFGKMGERDAAARGFVISKPTDSRPRYVSHITQPSR